MHRFAPSKVKKKTPSVIMLPLPEAVDEENKLELDPIDSGTEANISLPKERGKLTHSRSMSSNLVHHHDPMTPKEQKKIATDMFNQMKHLKEQNEAIGYHGFSGYLERHNSRTMKNLAAISDNDDTDIEDETEPDPDKQQKQSKSEDDHLLNRIYNTALRIFHFHPAHKSSSILSVIKEENEDRDSG